MPKAAAKASPMTSIPSSVKPNPEREALVNALSQFAAPNAALNLPLLSGIVVLNFLKKFSPFADHVLIVISGNGSTVLTQEKFKSTFASLPEAETAPCYWTLVSRSSVSETETTPTNGICAALALQTLLGDPINGLGSMISQAGYDGSYPERYFLTTPDIQPVFNNAVTRLVEPLRLLD